MIAAVILAAGTSRRMGKTKLFLPYKNHTIIEEVIDNVKASKADFICLVYGNEGERWQKLAGKKEISCIWNSEYLKGQSTSVIKGVEAVPDEAEGIVFVLGDQPFVSYKVIDKIIDTFYEREASIVVPIYAGIRGNPVLFDIKWRKELLHIAGDKGGREIIVENSDEVVHVHFEDLLFNMDIDTEEEYQKALMFRSISNCLHFHKKSKDYYIFP